MSCNKCDQHCHQGRNCAGQRGKRRASAFMAAVSNAMLTIAAMVLTCVLGVGSGVLFWIVTK